MATCVPISGVFPLREAQRAVVDPIGAAIGRSQMPQIASLSSRAIACPGSSSWPINCRWLNAWKTAMGLILLASPAAARSFGDYECSGCSGEKAGYEWAAEQDVTAKAECKGILRRWPDRKSFYHGCLAYVDDPDRGADLDDDGDEID
jgi:hypothetical protein